MLRAVEAPSSSRSRVCLVGTVHLDHESYAALHDLIVSLSPSVVATEMSEFGLMLRLGPGKAALSSYRRRLRKAGLTPWEGGEVGARVLTLRVPFEFLAARRAARRVGARITFLGRNRDSALWLLPLVREATDEARAEAMMRWARDLRTELATVLHAARRLDPSPPTSLRDRRYARMVHALAGREERVVTVVGWEHVRRGVPRSMAWILRQALDVQVWTVVAANPTRWS